jgi:hypothetical protein
VLAHLQKKSLTLLASSPVSTSIESFLDYYQQYLQRADFIVPALEVADLLPIPNIILSPHTNQHIYELKLTFPPPPVPNHTTPRCIWSSSPSSTIHEPFTTRNGTSLPSRGNLPSTVSDTFAAAIQSTSIPAASPNQQPHPAVKLQSHPNWTGRLPSRKSPLNDLLRAKRPAIRNLLLFHEIILRPLHHFFV